MPRYTVISRIYCQYINITVHTYVHHQWGKKKADCIAVSQITANDIKSNFCSCLQTSTALKGNVNVLTELIHTLYLLIKPVKLYEALPSYKPRSK